MEVILCTIAVYLTFKHLCAKGAFIIVTYDIKCFIGNYKCQSNDFAPRSTRFMQYRGI